MNFFPVCLDQSGVHLWEEAPCAVTFPVPTASCRVCSTACYGGGPPLIPLTNELHMAVCNTFCLHLLVKIPLLVTSALFLVISHPSVSQDLELLLGSITNFHACISSHGFVSSYKSSYDKGKISCSHMYFWLPGITGHFKIENQRRLKPAVWFKNKQTNKKTLMICSLRKIFFWGSGKERKEVLWFFKLWAWKSINFY